MLLTKPLHTRSRVHPTTKTVLIQEIMCHPYIQNELDMPYPHGSMYLENRSPNGQQQTIPHNSVVHYFDLLPNSSYQQLRTKIQKNVIPDSTESEKLNRLILNQLQLHYLPNLHCWLVQLHDICQ